MNNVVFQKIDIVNRYLKEFYTNQEEILSVFIVGSMYDLRTYQIRKNNDYDIRFIVKKVTPEILNAVEFFQKQLCEKLNDDLVCMGYNNIVGPVNHHLSDKKYNILLHILIHTIDDLKSFLPLTHQLKYRKYHTVICGENYLDTLVSDYSVDYIISCHEGIDYCLDMLKRNVYKYLEWIIDGDRVQFVYKECPVPESMRYELVFYSVKNIVLNLYEILILNKKQDVSFNDFLKKTTYTEQDVFLTKAVFLRSEKMIDEFGGMCNQYTINYLERIKETIILGEM